MAIPGITSRNSPMRFASITAFKLLTPVTLPPGRLKTCNKPADNWIANENCNDWNRASSSGRRFGGHISADRYQHRGLSGQ